MADADPFDSAASNRIGERIEGVTDQSEDLLDPDLFEYADQDVRHCLRHVLLLTPHRTSSAKPMMLNSGVAGAAEERTPAAAVVRLRSCCQTAASRS
jgi:hypothetical protein